MDRGPNLLGLRFADNGLILVYSRVEAGNLVDAGWAIGWRRMALEPGENTRHYGWGRSASVVPADSGSVVPADSVSVVPVAVWVVRSTTVPLTS